MVDYRNLAKYFILFGAVVVIFGAGIYVGKHQVVCKACKPEQVDFSLFWDAYNKLHEKYVGKEGIEDQKLIYGAIAGMAKSLGDPYTEFFEPSQAKMFAQDLSGSFEGIGVEISIRKDQLTVVAPLKGSPGERAGLKAGDVIVQIDGKSAADMSIDEAVRLIRGKRGTQVTLGVYRESWGDSREIAITRETIKINAIEWELKEGNVAYISMHQFDQQLPADFARIAMEIMQSPAQKIVLDLRNNPGGYLEVCQQIAGWFLESGQVVTIEDFGKNADPVTYRAQGNGQFARYPMVILMNGGSASASEILAGALRDNRGVKLVGEKSFGKGSVQEVVDLQDGASFMKVTVAKWLTPKGNSIAEVGLAPDIAVENNDSPDGEKPEEDAQLQKALEIIKTLQ